MKTKTWCGLLLPAGLLLATMLACALPQAAGRVLSTASNPSNLSVTVTTDNENYKRGQTVRISGTVKDSENHLIASGTATIQLSYETWKSPKSTVEIKNGSYGDNYYISYGNPAGAENAPIRWTITASAVDNLGNTENSFENINVESPGENDVYTVIFTSPAELGVSRGRTLTISVTVTHGENKVDADSVFANSPTGENIPLGKKALGAYESTYTVEFDDPAENWSISVEGRKTDNTFRAGGAWRNIKIVPATLTVNLQSPTRDKFEVGEEVVVKVEVLYPYGGGPVENATVSVNDPAGGSLTLTQEGSGVYSTSCTPQTSATWAMQVQANDSYGNSGNRGSLIIITSPRVPGFLEKYWWAVLSVILAIAFASAYKGWGKRREAKLADVQREMKEIPRLKREAAIKYFKDGTISRSAYDGLIKRYDARMDELKKEEAALKAKMKKRVKRKR